MIHDDLFQYLTTEPAFDGLFPGGIHHMSVPQDVDTWPTLDFQLVANTEVSEDLDSEDRLDQVNYQFAVTGDNSSAVIHASDVFNRVFREFRGMMGATRVQWIILGNIAHLEERRGDKLRRRVVLDFSIFFDL